MDIVDLSPDHCIRLLEELESVLNARQHKRIHLGEEIIVSGSLSKALKLPELKKRMLKYKNTNFEPYQNQLADIWLTMSIDTKKQVLDNIGFYQPEDYDWDDPRSNRKPLLKD